MLVFAEIAFGWQLSCIVFKRIDKFFMLAEVNGLWFSLTGGIHFQSDYALFVFPVQKKKRDHGILKFVRTNLIGTRHRLWIQNQFCTWRLPQHPEITMIIGWLASCLINGLKTGRCVIIGFLRFPHHLWQGWNCWRVPKLLFITSVVHYISFIIYYFNIGTRIIIYNSVYYRQNRVKFAEDCGYV